MYGDANPDHRLTSLFPSDVRGGLIVPKADISALNSRGQPNSSGSSSKNEIPPPSFRSHKDGQGSILGLDRLSSRYSNEKIEIQRQHSPRIKPQIDTIDGSSKRRPHIPVGSIWIQWRRSFSLF